jgi:hypothetical protein
MHLNDVHPAHIGAGFFAHPVVFPVSDAFERLPVNLSADEIRAMVLELLG